MKFVWSNILILEYKWHQVKWCRVGDSPTRTFVKMNEWCDAQPSTGKFSRRHASYNMQHWYFEFASDALLFTLQFK